MATAVRPPTPMHDAYAGMSHPDDTIQLSKGYSARAGSRPNSYAASNAEGYNNNNVARNDPVEPSPNVHSTRFHEELDRVSQRGSVVDGPSAPVMQRSDSQMSRSHSAAPSRASTLRKKSSLSRRTSLRRSGSRKSLRAGSVRSLTLGDREKYGVDGADDYNSAFYVPIPTNGSPTDALADRFQAWRKVLKDLIIFFKDLQKSYEIRSKLLMNASNIVNNSAIPQNFLQTGGLSEATAIIRDFHRQGVIEAGKAKELESEVIQQLTGLRSDLQKKMKEIKNLAGDFKNSVEKEMDGTRRTVRNLQEALGLIDTDPLATSGKGDPFILRLSVDRQLERQIEEENYLHRAFLNLEKSGRELEAIVVGEIQKAYNAYASILKREADEAYDTVEKLRAGPISMPKDIEWNAFLANTDELVDPDVPLRNIENITYPGKDHPATVEVRSGMLERKSKYLKSYTPGWYVLSPTHLHEFKSTDRTEWQTPVMSLYLPDQKLGSHSQPGSTSHKFMLKGRQTGAMHRGHSWVFRAESHETMMAWYEDIENLMGRSGEMRNTFVKRHFRSVSGMSFRSSDPVMEEDEADRTPYSAETAVLPREPPASEARPQPGGRFPSDVDIERHLHDPLSPSSGESSADRDLAAVADSLLDGRHHTISDGVGDTDQTRTANGTTGSPSRTPDSDSCYSDSVGEAAQQQATLTTQSGGPPPHDDATRAQGDVASNPPSDVASATTTDHRHHQVAPRITRRESASTVPTTTNITDYTNNTVPTSIDGDHEPAPMKARRSRSQHTIDSRREHAPISMEKLALTSVLESQITPPGTAQKEVGMPQEDGSQHSMTPSKDSQSALDLQIPGQYPPHLVA